MKKSIITSVFLVNYLLRLVAQESDSIIIKQVDSIIMVSRILTQEQKFDSALQINAIAEKLVLENFGKESASYGNVCFNHGRVLYNKFDNLDAEKWILESILIREKVLGKEHYDYANSLSFLGLVYVNLNQYEKAEANYLKSKSILEKIKTRVPHHYINCLGNLANLYSMQGQYEEAEAIFLEFIPFQEKIRGKAHLDNIGSLINLAGNLYELGKHGKAEELYLEAKSNLENGMNTNHPFYIYCLNNLGGLYDGIGQYEKAEILFLELKSIIEKVNTKDHRILTSILLNLGNVAANLGQFGKAETYYLELIDKLTKAGAKENEIYGNGLMNLARVNFQLRQYEKANTINLEAMTIFEKVHGKEHPDYMRCLVSMTSYYIYKGQYEKVEEIFLEVIGFWEKVFGKEHTMYTISLVDLADFYSSTGQYEKAASLYSSSAELYRSHITNSMRFLSEKEMNQYILKFEKKQTHLYSFIQKSKVDGAIIKTCFDNTLFFKGFLLNEQNQSKKFIFSDSLSTYKYNLFKSYGRRLAVEYTKPLLARKGVRELEEKANLLEKELARSVAGDAGMLKQINWLDIQKTLKSDEGILEFIHYPYVNQRQSDSIMYAVLFLRADDTSPHFITLFEENQLIKLLSNNKDVEFISQMYTNRGATPMYGESLQGLYDLIWKPLEGSIKNIKTIYYSPSGLLHRINIDAIPVDKNSILSDHVKLIRFGSTRSLVVSNLNLDHSSKEAVLYGGIRYNIDSTSFLQDPGSENIPLVKSEEISFFDFAKRSVPLRADSWNYLSGTRKEVDGISTILKRAKFSSQTFISSNATEESFKSIGKEKQSPGVLHIATHGFFFPDPKENVGNSQEAFNKHETVFKMSDHPMIRSGLILAGGNYAWKEGKPFKEGMEDGILTSYEISQMNLSNTELVVLSACETGLGDIKGNEGVYGLQRAFKIAGAKYLIMSLWQVPDRETKEFMVSFYKNWLTKKNSIPDAFRKTQREMRERFINPYAWAGFVLVE